jgi:hypothetical protein
MNNWQKEYERVSGNAVYFIEEYYNKLHPDKQIELTDEQRQQIFNCYKRIPLLNEGPISPFDVMRKIDELKKQGYKDWEIF